MPINWIYRAKQRGVVTAVTGRTLISFCEQSGEAVGPWVQAGYTCYIVDLQHPRGLNFDKARRLWTIGASVFELHPYHRWLPQGAVFGAMAWPECTHFSYSGQRWRRENGPTATAEGFRLFGACWDLLRFYELERGAWWLLENPKGIPWSWCKPDYVFHPWHYGDHESKETGIWAGGGFVMPAASVTTRPVDCGESVWKCAPGPERANARSRTSGGFARAVFIANHERSAHAMSTNAVATSVDDARS